MIFFVFLQSFTNALATVYTQKLLAVKKMGNNWQTLFMRIVYVIIGFLGLIVGMYSVSLDAWKESPYLISSLFVIGTILLYITYPLRRYAFLHEKISVLQPFTMAKSIFSILIAFLIFGEQVSLWTFWLSLIAIGIMIAMNVEWGKIVWNKYSLTLLASSFIQAIQLQVVLVCVKAFTPPGFFFIESVVLVIIAGILIVSFREIQQYKLITKNVLKIQVGTNTMNFISSVLGLVFYGKLGVVMTSLIMLLYLVFVYPVAYFVLGEIPSRKNLIGAFLIAICVGLGAYLK